MTIYLDPDQVPANLRNGYTGRKFRVEIAESVDVPSQQWDGGTRRVFSVVNLATGAAAPIRDDRPWPQNMSALGPVEIAPGFAIVESGTFCGKDAGLTFHIRPENASRLIPDQSGDEFDKAARAVLYGTRSYKSNYAGRDRFDMTCGGTFADFPGVTRAQWEAAKADLIARGYLNKRGAITTKGRNAAENIKREDS